MGFGVPSIIKWGQILRVSKLGLIFVCASQQNMPCALRLGPMFF